MFLLSTASFNPREFFWVGVLCTIALLSTRAVGIPVDRLEFGQSCDMSNSSSDFGFALRLGVKAAFNEINSAGGVHGGVNLTVISMDDSYVPEKAVNNTRTLLQKGVFGFIGYFGTDTSLAVTSMISDANLPFIGAYSGSMALRSPYNPSIINIRASYDDMTAALVTYLTTSLFLTRISVLYQADGYGLAGLMGVQRAMDALGLAILSNGTYPRYSDNVGPGLDRILDVGYPPQVIILVALDISAAKFIKLAKQRLPSDTYYAVLVTTNKFHELIGPDTSNILVTQAVPLPNNNTLLGRHYIAALQAINSTIEPDWASFEGYIAGRFAAAVIQRMQPNQLDGPHFIKSVYAPSIYVLDETLLLGWFTNGCNQGMRAVWISRVTGDHYESVLDDSLNLAPGQCFTDTKTMYMPLLFGHLYAVERVYGVGPSPEVMRFRDGVTAAFEAQNRNGGIRGHLLHLMSLPADDFHNAKFLMATQPLLGFVGNIDGSYVQELVDAKMPFLAPFSGLMPLRKPFRSSVVSVRASINDETMAIIRYVVTQLRLSNIALLWQKDEEGTAGRNSTLMALQFYNLKLICEGSYPPGADVDGAIASIFTSAQPEAVIMFGDANPLGLFILRTAATYPKLFYFATSSVDMILLRSELLGFSYLKRVYSSQVVPSPFDPSTLAQHFETDMKALNGSAVLEFAGMEGYLAGKFIVGALINARMDRITSSDALMDSIYFNSMFTVEDVQLGLFSETPCSGGAAVVGCECSQGMHQVFLTRLSPNQSAPFETISEGLFTFATCGVDYPPLSGSQSSSGSVLTFIAIYGSAFAGLLCIIGCIFCYRRARRRQRALQAAPNGKVTLCFTDVEGSTPLWETFPVVTMQSLSLHNEIVRELIKKYNGYEVKTQGDSFMIAFCDSVHAVQWSAELQLALLQADWPPELLNYPQTKAEYSADGVTLLYRGLRVRVGIHTGEPDVQYNARIDRVDYFGPMVNTCARIEGLAHGGQTLLSSETFTLTQHLTGLTFKYLGSYPLKGIREEQHIIQMLPDALTARVFPELCRTQVLAMCERKLSAGLMGIAQATVHDDYTTPCVSCSRPLKCLHCRRRHRRNTARTSVFSAASNSVSDGASQSGLSVVSGPGVGGGGGGAPSVARSVLSALAAAGHASPVSRWISGGNPNPLSVQHVPRSLHSSEEHLVVQPEMSLYPPNATIQPRYSLFSEQLASGMTSQSSRMMAEAISQVSQFPASTSEEGSSRKGLQKSSSGFAPTTVTSFSSPGGQNGTSKFSSAITNPPISQSITESNHSFPTPSSPLSPLTPQQQVSGLPFYPAIPP